MTYTEYCNTVNLPLFVALTAIKKSGTVNAVRQDAYTAVKNVDLHTTFGMMIAENVRPLQNCIRAKATKKETLHNIKMLLDATVAELAEHNALFPSARIARP